MKLMKLFLFTVLLSCSSYEISKVEVIKLDPGKIDSIKTWSDSMVVERIEGKKYVVMETYYAKDTSIAKRILRDSGDNVRAIIVLEDGHYLRSQNYFANGQLMGKLRYSETGVLDGPATYYYEDGRIRSKGAFKNGKPYGEWKNYQENGRLKTTEVYDDSGQLIETKVR